VLSIEVRMVPPAVDKERYPDRVLCLVERRAPGLDARILGRYVIGPADLERANPNLVSGDSIGASHHLDLQFCFARSSAGRATARRSQSYSTAAPRPGRAPA
jgi:phytoene dehydrogenase-like protein